MNLVFFEDDRYADFDPLTFSRPACMLLCGTSQLFRKWVEALRPDDHSFLCREYLAEFVHLITGKKVNEISNDDVILINGRFPPSEKTLGAVRNLESGKALTGDGELIACRLPAERPSKMTEALENLFDGEAAEKALSFFSVKDIKAEGFRYLWEVIDANGGMITREFENYHDYEGRALSETRGGDIMNPQHVSVSGSVSIAPSVVIDASEGPVIIGDNVSIEPFTFIRGPVFFDRDCRLVGGRIGPGCSFGPVCRVGGEIEESIMLGYCNKYHEGFIGHAYLGEWVNLGAMTTNSDLKNNYSKISVAVGDKVVDTGSIKVGCFIGDHTKTGIGTMLNTGISIGFSCNLYGAGLFAHPGIRSFSWGTPAKLTGYRLEKAIETAEVAMARRKAKMTDVHRKLFTHIYRRATGT